MDKPPPSGTVVIWEPKNFNPDYWDKLSEEDQIKYYSWAGYGKPRRPPHLVKAFVFICPILDADGSDSGHCVLLDMDNGSMQWMRHTCELRLATEEEL